MRLHNLGETEDAAQFVSGGRNANGRAFANFFKSAELRHVETSILDAASLVEVEGHLGVPLDAGHRVDHNRLLGSIWHVTKLQSASSRSIPGNAPPAVRSEGRRYFGARGTARNEHVDRYHLVDRP